MVTCLKLLVNKLNGRAGFVIRMIVEGRIQIIDRAGDQRVQ